MFEAEKRLEKQRFENFVPLKDRRPEHEFFDLENIYNQCLGDPIDISPTQDRGMLKYVMCSSTS